MKFARTGAAIAALATLVGLVAVVAGPVVATGHPKSAAPVAAVTKVLNIVALGDSFTAGNGAWSEEIDGEPVNWRDYVDEPEKIREYFGPVDCFRSRHNWTRRYLRALKATGDYRITYANHACSGATSSNLGGRNLLDTTRVSRSMPSPSIASGEVTAYANEHNLCSTGGYPYEQFWEAENGYSAFDSVSETLRIYFECQRFVRPQRDYVGPETDLVLMTIGGNDLGFSSIIERCFGPDIPGVGRGRDPDDCKYSIETASKDMPTAKEDIKEQIRGLFGPGRLTDRARVVVMGYPLLAMKDSGYKLGDEHWPVAKWTRDLGKEGEAMLAQMVSEVNDELPGDVDRVIFPSGVTDEDRGVPDHFAGHEPNPSWGNQNDEVNPIGWLHEIVAVTGEWAMESYHPNPDGHDEYMKHLFFGTTKGGVAFNTAEGRKPAGDADMVFTVDVSESMGPELLVLKRQLARVMASAAGRANSARFALVSFREDPRFSGDPGDYTSRVEQDFTYDPTLVLAAANRLVAAGGGGNRETMFSGLQTSLDLDWREGVKKSAIVVTDNWPHTPEPFTGITVDDVIDQAWAVDPAAISIVDTGNSLDNPDAQRVVTETAGRGFPAATEADTAVAFEAAVNDTLDRPHAWITDPTVVKVGTTVELDGSGSYSPTGEIVSYGWDYNGDRVPDETTTTPDVTHRFDQEFTGSLGLFVTDDAGRVSIATQHAAITVDGDEIPTDIDNCPAVENMAQIDTDADGVGDMCDPTPGWSFPEDPAQTKPSRLDGIPRPGNTLTAIGGEWNYPATYTYQWLYDGTEIPGATTGTYLVKTADVNHKVSVRITTSIDDYGTVNTETHDVTIDALPLTQLAPSSLTGIARPGNTLTANPSQWDGPTTSLFQWTRDGVPIPGATGATFLLSPEDVGHRIAVNITTRAEHHGAISADTHGARVERYVSTTRLRFKKIVITEGQVAKAKLTVTAAGYPTPVTGRLRFTDRRTTVLLPYLKPGHPTTTTFRLRNLGVGRHRIWVRYYGNRVIGRSRTQRITITVKPAPITQESL